MKVKILSLCLCLVMLMSLPAVEAGAEAFSSLDLSGTAETVLAVGGTSKIVVNGVSGSTKTALTSGVTFTSSNPEIAKVGADGTVTAVAKGITVIKAESSGLSKSILFMVGETKWGRTYDDAPEASAPQRTAVSGNAYLNQSGASVYTPSTDGKTDQLNSPTGGWVANTVTKANNAYMWWFYDDGSTACNNVFETYGNWYKYYFRITAEGYSFSPDYREVKESLINNVIPKTVGWHQFAVRFTKTDLKAYVDGELMYSIKRTTELYPYALRWGSGSSYIDDFVSVATGDAEIDTYIAEEYNAIDLSATEHTELDLTDDSANKKFNKTQIVAKGMKNGKVIETIDSSALTYESSNTAVATVSATGLVEAKSEGLAVISVSDGEYSSAVMIIVSEGVSRSRYWGWNDWAYENVANGVKSEVVARTGTYSLEMDTSVSKNNINYIDNTNSVNAVGFWFYDDMNTADFAGTGPMAAEYHGNNLRIALYKKNNKYGINPDKGCTLSKKSEFASSKGWHQVVFVSEGGRIAAYIDGQLAAIGTNTSGANFGTYRIAGGTADIDFWLDDLSSTKLPENVKLPGAPDPVIKPSVSASGDVVTRKNATVLGKEWDYTAYLYSTIDFGAGYETGDYGFELTVDEDADALVLPVVIDENGDKQPEAFAIRVVGNDIAGSYSAVPYVIADGEKIMGNTVTFTFDENTQEANIQ